MTRNKTLKCILSFSKHAKTYNPLKMTLASPERVATTNRLRRTHCQKLMGTLHSNESIKICSKRIVKRKVVGIRSILRVLLDEKRFWRWKVSSSSHGHTHTPTDTQARCWETFGGQTMRGIKGQEAENWLNTHFLEIENLLRCAFGYGTFT